MDFLARNYTDRVGKNYLRVTMKGDNGLETVRTFTVSQFCKILKESEETEVTLHEVKKNFWPKDTLSAYFGDYNNYLCIWRVPAMERVVVYANNHYHVPFPTMVFKIRVKGGAIVEKKCFCMAKDDDESLFQYPFGNVSSFGGICTGNIMIEGLSDSVEAFSDEFFLGKTNNDYYGDGSGRVKPACSQQKLLEKLEKLDEFPSKWLVKKEVTLSDFLNVKNEV